MPFPGRLAPPARPFVVPILTQIPSPTESSTNLLPKGECSSSSPHYMPRNLTYSSQYQPTSSPPSSQGGTFNKESLNSTTCDTLATNDSEKIPTRLTNDSEGWLAFVKKVRQYDESMVSNWKEEIDTLLVFAGLFSAVVTAFILQLYEELQPDNSDLVVQILSAISTQLQTTQLVPASNASISTNQTQAPFPKIAFRAPASVVRINVLWFCSLIVSLVVGSLGMLTKQWLRDYLSVSYTTPRELVRIRQYRQTGLKVWRVTEIIAFLPLLLQFALILFLVGLIDLLWSINFLVAALVTFPIAFWVLTYTATTCAPAFFPQCPYKSPQARIFDSLCHPFRKVYRSRFKQRGFSGSRDYLLVADMTEHSGLFWGADKLETRMRSELEVDAVVNADTMFVDDEFLEKTIKTCVRDFSGSNVVLFLRQFVGYRTKQSRDYLGDHRDTLWRLGEHGIVTVVQIAVDALWRFMDDFQSVGTKSVEPWVTELLDFISAASIHTQWYGKRLTKTSDSRPVIELLLRFVTSGIERLDMDAFQLLLPILSDPRGTAITPLITSSEDLSRIINCARLHLRDHDPLQICHAVLSLVLSTHQEPVNANQDQLSHFMVELTTSVRREIRRGPASHFSKNRHRHLDRLCLNMAEVVNTRTPGVVEDKLLKILGRDIMPSTLVGDQFEARLMRRSSR